MAVSAVAVCDAISSSVGPQAVNMRIRQTHEIKSRVFIGISSSNCGPKKMSIFSIVYADY